MNKPAILRLLPLLALLVCNAASLARGCIANSHTGSQTMRPAIRRAIVIALPILFLPTVAQASLKQVGIVINGHGAFILHDGQVTPASSNAPIFQGDKVVTIPGGSANVDINSQPIHLSGSSEVNSNGSIVTMDSKLNGNNHGVQDAGTKLANANFRHRYDPDNDGDNDRGNRFGRCHKHHHNHGRGNGHGDDDDDCPVSP